MRTVTVNGYDRRHPRRAAWQQDDMGSGALRDVHGIFEPSGAAAPAFVHQYGHIPVSEDGPPQERLRPFTSFSSATTRRFLPI